MKKLLVMLLFFTGCSMKLGSSGEEPTYTKEDVTQAVLNQQMGQALGSIQGSLQNLQSQINQLKTKKLEKEVTDE